MRVKSLLTSRIGKKTSTKKDGKCKRDDKEVELLPSKVGKVNTNRILVQVCAWRRSTCVEEDLQRLVEEGFLQSKDMVEWRSALEEAFPMELTSEIVIFTHFIERGLAVPCCDFFRGILYYYRLEAVHLNPNSIVHIGIFIHLCEVFLGIRPHF